QLGAVTQIWQRYGHEPCVGGSGNYDLSSSDI
ncbi:hypothetical protein CEXT_696691, partial [Caerostris extrusa]